MARRPKTDDAGITGEVKSSASTPYSFFFYLFFILLFILTRKLPFFWDKDILYSRIAHWLLENHFSLVLPNNIDPGYPPALGYLLALAWKITGINLPVVHFLMLPFTLGIVWQTRRLAEYFMPGRGKNFALLVILVNTSLLAQTVVFSTDLVMLFFMLLGLNAVIRKRHVWLMVAVTGLLFSHMRGLTVAATLGIFDVFLHGRLKEPVSWLKRLPDYLPALALFIAWGIFHYRARGWIGYHPASPWAECYEIVDGRGLIKNLFVFIWRLGDFGMIILWAIAVYLLLFRRSGKKTPEVNNLKPLLLLLISCLVLTAPPMLVYKIMNGHRYLIPVYYFLSFLVAMLLYSVSMKKRTRNLLAVLTVLALLSGNFWIYPDHIAKGWDANLAHLPYHHLRKKMMAYIDQHHIPMAETGSGVPNTARIDYIELNGDQRAFHRADTSHDQYIFYSNIFNMFSNREIDLLKNHWKVEKEFRCMQVRVTLYKK